jgi:putative transposase
VRICGRLLKVTVRYLRLGRSCKPTPIFRIGAQTKATKGDRGMKKGRFTEEQIIGVLKQHEAGRKVPELAREIGVSEATIYTWKSKFGGMDVSDAQRLKGLEEENRQF